MDGTSILISEKILLIRKNLNLLTKTLKNVIIKIYGLKARVYWRKSMDFKKILAVSVMICLSFGIFGLFSPDVGAADLTDSTSIIEDTVSSKDSATFDVCYEATDAYRSSKYYENLKKVPKSGDQAINVVAIALSQVGYHEGDGNEDFGGLNTAGTKDFVEYNMVFGKIDNNIGYGYSWCASFATWCLRQAGVTVEQSAQTDSKTYISSWKWKRAFEDMSAFNYAEGYTPVTGDIIFFKDVDDPNLYVETSHIGIVLYSDEDNVYTVEGNANTVMGNEKVYDSVAVKTHPLDSKFIVGYGTPTYENTEEKEPYGWRSAEDSESSPKPLEKLIDEAKSGTQIVPVWENEISIAEIVVAVVLALLLIAVITVLSIMTFKKKPDTRNSGRHKENKKSRNKYHGKNKGAKVK